MNKEEKMTRKSIWLVVSVLVLTGLACSLNPRQEISSASDDISGERDLVQLERALSQLLTRRMAVGMATGAALFSDLFCILLDFGLAMLGGDRRCVPSDGHAGGHAAAACAGLPEDQFREIYRISSSFDTILVGSGSYDEMFAYLPDAETEPGGSEIVKAWHGR
jgi:hypothetical protein